jgi:hypothetical protein
VSFGLIGQNDDHTTRLFATASRTLGSTSPGWSTSQRCRLVVSASKRNEGGAPAER